MNERARIVTLRKCFFANRDSAGSIIDSCSHSCSRHHVGSTLLLAESQWMLISRGQSGRSVKLTSDLHLIPCLERVEFKHRAPYFIIHAI